MQDRDILEQISRLTEEEHQLERSHIGSPLRAEELEKLRSLEVQLDQCWDLLNQRRARRLAGANPDDATVRPASVVEHFEQ